MDQISALVWAFVSTVHKGDSIEDVRWHDIYRAASRICGPMDFADNVYYHTKSVLMAMMATTDPTSRADR